MAQGWRITNQRKTTRITAGGRFEDAMEVHYTTDSGTDGWVCIPMVKFTPEAVREAIDSEVSVIDAVHGL